MKSFPRRLSLTVLRYSLRRMLGSFWLLPSLMALGGIVLALVIVALDQIDWTGPQRSEPFLTIDAVSARAVLTTVASAAMTVASLVYSLTLVVFTLAAGNIAPRLVESFTRARINQVTMGAFLATFLYSLVVLFLISSDEAPAISAAFAIVLAVVSFACLLAFVHETARSVFVDNEVARLSANFRAALAREKRVPGGGDASALLPEGSARMIAAPDAGYIQSIDKSALMRVACARGWLVALQVKPGAFVLPGMSLMAVHGEGAGALDEKGCAALTGAVVVGPTRTENDDLEFPFRLQVEIAARALSPGINDFYTALTCIDQITAGLLAFHRAGPPDTVLRDERGQVRILRQPSSFAELAAEALHPIRQSMGGSAPVALRLLGALSRLAPLVGPAERDVLAEHAVLVREQASQNLAVGADIEAVAARHRAFERVLAACRA